MFDMIERVSVLLKERNMSYAELCRRSGINPSTFRIAAVRGTHLSISTVEQICTALNIPVWKFFFVPDEMGCWQEWLKM